MNLRKEARGRHCTVMLDGVCNGNTETTVLAHWRGMGISGMGIKAPDLLGAWACSDCHDAVDRRRFTDIDPEHVELQFLRGIIRTQATLIKEGKA